jgi:two-component system, OmpR family, sensor histidine kinase VicK
MIKQNNLPDNATDKLQKLELDFKRLKEENEEYKKVLQNFNKVEEEQRLFKERYKQSQVRFRTIFEQSKLGNKILNGDLDILEANEAMISMLGYSSKKDILNRKITEFSHPDFVDHWHKLQVALWQKKIPSFVIDTCLVRKDRSTFWCRVTSILFEDNEVTLGYTIIEDIDEKKSLEVRAQRLYENQENIMHMVAHDLKSPLQTIQSLSALIEKNIRSNNQEQALHYLSLLQQIRERGYKIINDLLLIGDLESEKTDLQDINIADLLTTVLEQAKVVANKKGIQIFSEFDGKELLVKADREKILRVLDNLLSNAIKFSHEGQQVKLNIKEKVDSLTIEVQDQGIGIPESLRTNIFNKFTNSKRKGTKGEHTTGLGLFISKRIIEIHKGKIWFESSPTEGTTFFINLPKPNRR